MVSYQMVCFTYHEQRTDKSGAGPFVIDRVDPTLLRAGTWSSSWIPKVDHPSIAPENVEAASRVITAGILLAIQAGAFESSDAWNMLLPNYEFEDAEDFLKKAWHGKS